MRRFVAALAFLALAFNVAAQPFGSRTPFYAVTAAETAAGVTTVDLRYPELHVYRYGRNTTPCTTNMTTALTAALSVLDQYDAGVLTLPNECVAWDGNLDVPRYARIIGGGWGSKLKALSSSALLRFDQGDNEVERVLIEGSVTTPGSYVGTAIQVGVTGFVGRIQFKDVYVRRFQVGVSMRAALWTRFEDCFIEFNRTGVVFDTLVNGTSQNNDIAFLGTVIGFNERQGIATVTNVADIASRGLRILGGSIEGNGDADFTLYAQAQLANTSEVDISTYFESLAASKPDALTFENLSGQVHDTSFIGARDALKDSVGNSGLLRVHGVKASGIVSRALNIAGCTDCVAYNNSWGSPGTASIFTGTRTAEITGRMADYRNETTTFTPTLIGLGTAGTPTYTIQTGVYSRVGNLVYVQGRITISAKTGMAGSVAVSSLPATAANITNINGGIDVVLDGVTVTGARTQFSAYIPPNTTRIELFQQGTTASASIDASSIAAATTVVFSGWYAAQ